MRKLSSEEKERIALRIKNQEDISDLIKDKDISGMDLSGAIIKDFSRPGTSLNNTNLSRAIIGQEGIITNLSNCDCRYTNFNNAQFLGLTWLRRCDCRQAVFKKTFAPYVEYQHSDFRGASFCNVILSVGSDKGLGAIFSKNFMEDLKKYWKIEGE
jgi:uncharacterized protein YjbI with pentapeptide repeats